MFDARVSVPAGQRWWCRSGMTVVAGMVVAMMSVLIACTAPPDAGLPDDGMAVSLDLAVGVLEVVSGASESAALTVARSGPVGDVTLGVVGPLPAGVSVSFSPEFLGPGETTSTLTVTADAASEADHVELTVLATAGVTEAKAALTLIVSRLLVIGRVLDGDGNAIPAVAVEAQGHTDVTGLDGSFLLPDIAVPYAVTLASRSLRVVHRYDGLTSSEPELVMFEPRYSSPDRYQAVVSGLVLDGDPVPPGELVTICAEAVDANVDRPVAGCTMVHENESSYELFVGWDGPAVRGVRLHAFHTSVVPDDVVVEFLGYASPNAQLTDGASLSIDLALEPIATTPLTGTVVPGAGMDPSLPPFVVASVRFGAAFTMSISGDFATGDFSLPVPIPAGSNWTYDVFATSPSFTNSRWFLDVGLDAGTLVLPDSPEPVRPLAPTAPVPADTEFEVAGLDGFAKTFSWSPDAQDAVAYAVTTLADVATIPYATVIGPIVPPSGAYRWQVTSSHGDDVDRESWRLGDARRAVVAAVLRSGPPPLEDGLMSSITAIEFEFSACCEP